MRPAANPVRSAWALVFAIMLSLRLLGSAGYMPSLHHGSLTLIACPDADLKAPLALGAMHHHRGMGHEHSMCPYAAAAALGAVGPDFTPLVGIVLVAMALQLGRAFVLLRAQRNRERPPAIGPPLPA